LTNAPPVSKNEAHNRNDLKITIFHFVNLNPRHTHCIDLKHCYTGLNVDVSVFHKGQEFWLAMPELPLDNPQIKIEKTKNKEYFGARISIFEKHRTFYDKGKRICQMYEDFQDGYIECIR
jgi:hypothetical protein